MIKSTQDLKGLPDDFKKDSPKFFRHLYHGIAFELRQQLENLKENQKDNSYEIAESTFERYIEALSDRDRTIIHLAISVYDELCFTPISPQDTMSKIHESLNELFESKADLLKRDPILKYLPKMAEREKISIAELIQHLLEEAIHNRIRIGALHLEEVDDSYAEVVKEYSEIDL